MILHLPAVKVVFDPFIIHISPERLVEGFIGYAIIHATIWFARGGHIKLRKRIFKLLLKTEREVATWGHYAHGHGPKSHKDCDEGKCAML